jgi:hypothetical protein
VSKKRECVFVSNRECPFNTKNIPFETCQVCIEAWKTEIALKKRETERLNVTEQQKEGLSLPVIEKQGSSKIKEKLKEIESQLKNDEISPIEYIQLRNTHINNLIEGRPSIKINEEKKEENEINQSPRNIRVAVIAKSFFKQHIYTAPKGWKLPEAISSKVVNMIFDMNKKKPIREIRLRSGDYKIAGVASGKNKIALMILDADEDFESYEAEINRVEEILEEEKFWANAVKKIYR